MTQHYDPNVHEIVVLLRNKVTGVETMVKLVEAFDVSIGIEREPPEPWFYPGEDFYARLVPPVTQVNLEISASGRNLRIVKDTANTPIDDEEPNKWR